MELLNKYRLENIKNETAQWVYQQVQTMIDEGSLPCECENCVLDLIAYTLNRVPPMYSTSLLGNLHPDPERMRNLEQQIADSLRDGCKRLEEHPHHD